LKTPHGRFDRLAPKHALLDHQPVLAIAGQQSRNALGGAYQQELDLAGMFKDVAGAFVQQATSPAQVRHLVDRAVRIAVSRRTVTCDHSAERFSRGGLRRATAQARHAPLRRRLFIAADHASRPGPAPRSRRP
jgi:hypothetical protein